MRNSKQNKDRRKQHSRKKALPPLPSHSRKKNREKEIQTKKLLEHGSLHHFLVNQPINTSSSFISLDIPSTNQHKTQLSKRAEEERTHHSHFLGGCIQTRMATFDNPKLLHLAKKIQQGKWILVKKIPSKNPFQKTSRGTFRPCCNTEIREKNFRALYLPPSSSHVLLLVYCSTTLLCGRSEELGIRFPNPVAPRGSFSHMLSRENWKKKKKKQKKSASETRFIRNSYAIGEKS